MVESGRRHLTAEEWLLLPSVLTAALKSDVPYRWSDLVETMGHVALTAELSTYGATLDHLVQQGGTASPEQDENIDRPETRRASDLVALERVLRQMWTGDTPPLVAATALTAAAGEAERKAARVLGVSPVTIAAASFRSWGRSLTEEREARLAEKGTGDASPRVLQAQRGHVTRALLSELSQQVLDVKPRGKKTKTRVARRVSKK